MRLRAMKTRNQLANELILQNIMIGDGDLWAIEQGKDLQNKMIDDLIWYWEQ